MSLRQESRANGQVPVLALGWHWGFYPEDDDGGLELVPIEEEKYKHAVATPELCGACEATDASGLK